MTVTDLADDLEMFVAGERVVLEAAVHLLVPVSPLHIELRQRLGATRLKDGPTEKRQLGVI